MYGSKADIKSKLIYLNYCLPKVKNQPANNKTLSQKPHNIPSSWYVTRNYEQQLKGKLEFIEQ